MKRIIGTILVFTLGTMIAGCAQPMMSKGGDEQPTSRRGKLLAARQARPVSSVSAVSVKDYFEKNQYDKTIVLAWSGMFHEAAI
jgi:hypothetical protein